MYKNPVFYVSRMLPAYRLDVFEQLNKRLQGNLVVCHGQPPNASSILMRDSEVGFQREFLKNRWYGGETAHLQFYKKIFRKHGPPSVLLAEESPRSIMLPALLRHARKQGAGRVLWGIFYSVHRPFDPSHPLQRYRIRMASSVEALALYGNKAKEYLKPFIPEEQLFVARNTLHVEKLLSLYQELEKEGKKKVRRRLGLPEELPVFCFTGQLIPRKGTAALLQFFEKFSQQSPASLVVIGGGPEREVMEDYVNTSNLKHVHFLGSVPRFEDSAPYMYASDMMVIPGYVGLVANHALGLGVPLLSREAPGNLPFHGPEVENLIPGFNGELVPRDDLSQLVSGARKILSQQDEYAKNALTFAKEKLKLEYLVDTLESAIQFAYFKANQKHAHSH